MRPTDPSPRPAPSRRAAVLIAAVALALPAAGAGAGTTPPPPAATTVTPASPELTAPVDPATLRVPPTLRPGSSGAAVLRLQTYLRAAGITVPLDGEFGPATRRGVIRLQRRLRVRATGIATGRLLVRLGLGGTAPVSGSGAADPSAASEVDIAIQWPIHGDVSSGFGPRGGRMHEGIDITRPVGTPVTVATSGVVITAESQDGYGNLVVVDHGLGVTTRYAHLASFAVFPGQAVGGSQVVGRVGMTGRTSGPHLHFEVRIDGRAVDPRPLLPAR